MTENAPPSEAMTVTDPHWLGVINELRALPRFPTFVPNILLPLIPGSVSLEQSDARDIDCEAYFAVHKNQLYKLPEHVLSAIMQRSVCTWANGVFAVFSTVYGAGPTAASPHLAPSVTRVRRWYAATRGSQDTRTINRLVFIHIPRTAGTSVYSALSGAFGDTAYFDNRESFREYNSNVLRLPLIAGHFWLEDVMTSKLRDSIIISIVRDPFERVLSEIKFARREIIDPRFDANSWIQKMRTLNVAELVDQPDFEVVCNLQVLTFGSLSGVDEPREKTLERAIARLSNQNMIVAPLEQARLLLDRTSNAFGVTFPELPRENKGTMAEQYPDFSADELALLERRTAETSSCEQALIAFVRDRFTERFASALA
jgi:hypothetical protein